MLQSKMDGILNRIENPFETSEYIIEEQLKLLKTIKLRIANVTTAKKRLELQKAKLQIELNKIDDQAKNAVQSGRDDLAEKAMEDKKPLQAQINSLDENIKDLIKDEQNIKKIGNLLDAMVKAFDSKKKNLKSRADLLKDLLVSSDMSIEGERSKIEMEMSKIRDAAFRANEEMNASNDLLLTELIKYGIQKEDAKPEK